MEENEEFIITRYKEVLSEKEMAERPDWESMGIAAPEGEDDFKWVPIVIRKSAVYAICDSDEGTMLWFGGEVLIVDIPVNEALLKIS